MELDKLQKTAKDVYIPATNIGVQSNRSLMKLSSEIKEINNNKNMNLQRKKDLLKECDKKYESIEKNFKEHYNNLDDMPSFRGVRFALLRAHNNVDKEIVKQKNRQAPDDKQKNQ